MKKSLLVLFAVMVLVFPLSAFADDSPLPLAAGANPEAVKHNNEGIDHFKQGHFDVALHHFEGAAKADSNTSYLMQKTESTPFRRSREKLLKHGYSYSTRTHALLLSHSPTNTHTNTYTMTQ